MSPYLSAPPWLDSGDTAWQLAASSLVGLQSIPGLAILYAGLAKKKWALNSAVMCFYAFAAVLLVWSLWAYNMAFGRPLHLPGPAFLQATVGIPGPALNADALLGRAFIPLASAGMPALHFSGSVLVYFQFVFAAITPILIAGAVLGRMNFKAWMIFVPLWTTFSYSIGAFMIWGGGWLSQLGAVDYSGGYVIHLAAGVSGFVAAAMVGPRLLEDKRDFEPHNLIIALCGAGLLWLGWNGFNGGGSYFAGANAGAAVLNTNLATATALLVWLALDMFSLGHASAVSMINGMITGLVAITPCAGYVDGFGAIAVGLVAGLIPWFSLNKLGDWSLLNRVDDTFSVLHTHGVASLVGGLMVGLVANPKMIVYLSNSKATPPVSVAGLLYGGGWAQLKAQLIAALVIIVLNVAATYLILKVVSVFVSLRASDGEVEGGDLAIHGMDPVPLQKVAPVVECVHCSSLAVGMADR
jgi:Amt family ammonium transporter